VMKEAYPQGRRIAANRTFNKSLTFN